MTASEPARPLVAAARLVFSEPDLGEISGRVVDVLRTGRMTLGHNTAEFETAFAQVHQAPFAVATSSGTAALEIILRALAVSGADVVIPANTFAATAFAVLRAGARPVLADVDAETFALSPATVADAVTPRTAAVVLVHIGGLISPQAPELRGWCEQRGIALVEDAAHAHGSRLHDTPAGHFGVAAAFSFYPTKVITSGEGGMVITSDRRIRDEALTYRDQGKAGFGENVHTREGYAWRISEMQAATGVVHLRHLPQFLDVRRRVAARYTEALRAAERIRPLAVPPAADSNHYKYLALLDESLERDEFGRELAARYGVELSGPVYERPLHHQPVFAELAHGPLPVAERVCARHVCLPVHSDMTQQEVDQVIAAVLALTGP